MEPRGPVPTHFAGYKLLLGVGIGSSLDIARLLCKKETHISEHTQKILSVKLTIQGLINESIQGLINESEQLSIPAVQKGESISERSPLDKFS